MNERLVRDVLFPLHERLKGKPTFPWLRELERTQWLPPAALREYQLQRMLALVEWAYANTPYYRGLLDDHGLAPGRIRLGCGRARTGQPAGTTRTRS